MVHIAEIIKVKETGKVPPPTAKLLNVFQDKPTRLIVKVAVPVREYPKVSINDYYCRLYCIFIIQYLLHFFLVQFCW